MAGRRVVLVTGCSKGGIGYELAKAFASAGCEVFATARRRDSLEGLYEFGIELEELDVTDTDSIARVVESIVKKSGRIDVLVNNAGTGCTGPLAEIPLQDVRSNFETNVFGALAMVQAVVPHMAAQKSGRIVNIGSVVGWVATPWGGSYCASKSAMHSLTHTLRMELRPFGIKVVLVCPGSIKSNIGVNNLKQLDEKKWNLYAAYQSEIESRATVSQNSNSTPTDEFARKIVQLISPHFHAPVVTLAIRICSELHSGQSPLRGILRCQFLPDLDPEFLATFPVGHPGVPQIRIASLVNHDDEA